jgi:hypothetical protein
MMREITDNNFNNNNTHPTDNNQLVLISKLSSAVSNTAFQKQQEKRHTLGSLDILCGKTSTAFNHEGNKRFRQTIALHLQRYMNAPTRHAKSVVIASVVSILRRDMSARFVKMTKSASGEHYVELNKKKCQEKVGHALRDQAAATVSSSSSTTTSSTSSATKTTKTAKTTKTTHNQQQQEHVLSEIGSSPSTPEESSAPDMGRSIDPMREASTHQESSSTTSSISACEREWIQNQNSTSRQEGKEVESIIDYDMDPIPLSELGEHCPYSFLQELMSSSSSSSSSTSSASSSSYYTNTSSSSASGSAEAYQEFDDDELDSQIYDFFLVSG